MKAYKYETILFFVNVILAMLKGGATSLLIPLLERAFLSANLDVWVKDLPFELDVVFQADLVHL